MNKLAQIDKLHRPGKRVSTRPNWLIEIEPYSRTQGSSLQDLRDNLRLKEALKTAVKRDLAPAYLIEAIRIGIRA